MLKNQLLKEKAELARNQFMLDNIQSQLTTEMRVAMEKLEPPKSKVPEEKQHLVEQIPQEELMRALPAGDGKILG